MNAVPEAPTGLFEGVLELQSPLPLRFGGELSNVRVAWRLVGDPAAPVIAALGGISAGRAVTDHAGNKGWWSDISVSTFSVAAAARPARAPAKLISPRLPPTIRLSSCVE
jgi:hypothetical protein